MVSTGKMLAFINALGGNSGPSEVVILPETELTELTVVGGSETMGQYSLFTPFENKPTGGSTCKFIWGGVEYTSPVVDATAAFGTTVPLLVCGNTDMIGATEMIGSNPAPDAPFFAQMAPDGIEEDGVTFYLAWACTADSVADPPVLSIVQVGGASGGEGAGGVVTATAVIGDGPSVTSIDKTYSELLSAVKAGKYVQMMAKIGTSITAMPFVFWMDKGDSGYMMFSVEAKTIAAAIQYNADGTAEWAQ